MGKAASLRVHAVVMAAAPDTFDDDKLYGFGEDQSITLVEPISVLTERPHRAF